jgi:GTP-binding protein LepA
MHNIRNFCIIAHIDHGKSTLSDRILERTGTISEREMRDQLLDSMDLERERGITIKMQPVRIGYKGYELNLIDTPGHVDFNYEVSRSLAAVEGAVLLVDATKGVQAQTVANLYLAIDQDLTIIPAVNKVDLPNARVEEVKAQIVHLLGCEPEDILEVSGKTGQGVEILLDEIITKIPAPEHTQKLQDSQHTLRALIFDSNFDSYKGVIAHIRVFEGEVRKNQKLFMLAKKEEADALEVGVFRPQMDSTGILEMGQIGYIATGLKDVGKVRVGDTLVLYQDKEITQPLTSYKEPTPMVFASIFPESGEDYPILADGLEKLRLTDSSLTYEHESKDALGKGFRCGFLGMLHLEIISERLEREFGLKLVISTPSVSYRLKLTNGEEYYIYSPSDLPDQNLIEVVYEPWVKMEVITPAEYLGGIMELMSKNRGEYKNTDYLTEDRVVLGYEIPLSKVIVDFYDQLKSVSSGFASVSYESIGDREADVVRMDILVAGELVEALSQIVYSNEAFEAGKKIVHTLKNHLSKQQFTVALQAAIGGKIVARETLSAYRKDVLAKLYGGDRTRKDKLLKKQKAGKKRMASRGKVHIPKEVYLQVLKK